MSSTSLLPIYKTLDRIPGGMMLVPLLCGSLIDSLCPSLLQIGGFTTALLTQSHLPFIALLIFATGTQMTGRSSRPILATTAVIVCLKTIVPASLLLFLAWATGMNALWGISILAALAAFDNSNGGLWLAFTGQYGQEVDRAAYMASALNDGPFFTMLFLGMAGLAAIPLTSCIAALIPFILGWLLGAVDPAWRVPMRQVPTIVIPFLAFSLGTQIDFYTVFTGGLSGLLLGILVTPITGGLVYLGYRWILRRGAESGLGFAAGTTAGNAVVTPALIAEIDATWKPYVGLATAQIATCVLVTAILAPLWAVFFLKRAGAFENRDSHALAVDAKGDRNE